MFAVAWKEPLSNGSQPIRIMNLHGTAEQVTALVDGERYFP